MYQRRIQDFKLGGAHLKKLRRAEGGAKFFGYFVWKITILRKKNHIFSNFRGGGEARRVRPPLDPPHVYVISIIDFCYPVETSLVFLPYKAF